VTAETLKTLAAEFVASAVNTVPAEKARHPRAAGIRIYDEPLFGFAAAGDAYLASLNQSPGAGICLRMPEEWLPGARTIISYFLPFTEIVRSSNRGAEYPSPEWLNARIEGEAANRELAFLIQAALKNEGHEALAPGLDEHFRSAALTPEDGGPQYTSNWSERHVAYACGLGTFALSKGLITRKGIAGRFGSVITNLLSPPTPRGYSGLYDYCTRCGACVRNCPARAISLESGKDHVPCSRFLNKIKAENEGYYGCGKCQVKTPCEAGIPARKAPAA
jgi:epoxyqueuosine reductase QueG